MTETTSARLLDWQFRSADAPTWTDVRLPHDAMIREPRDPESVGGADLGWFPGGVYEYRTTWHPAEPTIASLLFEGVQGTAEVSLNGAVVGTVRSGYHDAEIPLVPELITWEGDNELLVRVDNSAQPSSRWYSGSGLFRPVHVILRPPTSFTTDGLRLTTRALTAASAVVDVEYFLQGDLEPVVEVEVELSDGIQVVASQKASGSAGKVRLHVTSPQPWSAESPHLYTLTAIAKAGEEILDQRSERVGLRTVDVDARTGLRINGAPVKLRGACIHHDHGLLGAAGHRAAEFRRITRLKDAGFNAVRSAHHPMSRDLLDACDELGMLVLDEFADYWVVSKTRHDGATGFRSSWRGDADRLIAKDRNRPSVVMYAIGNEIPETAKPEGVALAEEIAEHFRRSDPHRPTTLAINLFLNAMVALDKSPYAESQADEETSMAGSTEANVMINHIGRMMNVVSRLPIADRASRAAFATVDVAGYNYGLGRYARDVKKYPHRVILGTETLPGDIATGWDLVLRHPAIIGDFVWVGWEFLGEAGVGAWVPGRRAGLSKPYPYILHGGGLFDLIGQPDASLRLFQAAWGTLTAPAIAVRPVDRSGEPFVRSAWRSTDAVESWSWHGCEGRMADIEVYSTADHVELFLNGRSLGRRRAGRKHGYLARFRTRYEPGVLTAVDYRDGVETARSELRSARGPLSVRLEPESGTVIADGRDLAYVSIQLGDTAGTVEMLADDDLEITVNGPAELVGLGTASPTPRIPYTAAASRTHRGRALAILRSTGGLGTVTVSATTPRTGAAEVELQAVAAPDTTSVVATPPQPTS